MARQRLVPYFRVARRHRSLPAVLVLMARAVISPAALCTPVGASTSPSVRVGKRSTATGRFCATLSGAVALVVVLAIGLDGGHGQQFGHRNNDRSYQRCRRSESAQQQQSAESLHWCSAARWTPRPAM